MKLAQPLIWLLLAALLAACGSEPDDSNLPDADLADVGPDDDAGDDADEPPGTLVIPAALELDGELNQSASQSFAVENIGEGLLAVTLDPRQSWLSLSLTQLELDAGQSSEITLTAACREIDEVRIGELDISSDDPALESASITVTLTCGDAIARADLAIVISGLPSGLPAQVQVSGPDGFEQTLTASTDLEDVTPGTYVVEAAVVSAPDDDQTLWAAVVDRQEVGVALGQQARAIVEYAQVPGALVVEVAGLPAGAQAPLDLEDDAGDSIRLPANARIDALAPGDYTLIPRDVSAEDTLYSAPTRALSIVSDQTTTLSLTYEPGLGSLALTIEGLDGLTPEILVSGPQGFAQTLSTSQTLSGLEPGEYTLTGQDVVEGPARFQAAPRSVVVSAGQQAEATLSYEVVPGELQIEAEGLGGESFSVRIEGPSGTLNELGPLTLSDLLPGEYTLTFIDRTLAGETLRASPSELSVTVSSDGPTAQASTTYGSNAATLLLDISAPTGARLDFEIRQNAQVVESFFTLGSLLRELTLPAGSYTLTLVGTPSDAFGNPLTIVGDNASFTLAGGQELTLVVSATSSLVVTSSANTGPGSLREVIANANAGSIITFASNVTRVNLTSTITLTRDVTLAGPGDADALIIAGAGNHRLFSVPLDVNANVFNLTLQNGFADQGGAISGRGSITLQEVDLRNNAATLSGGAISISDGNVTLRRVRAIGNSALNDGGALSLVTRNISVEDSLFENNSAGENGGAIFALVSAWTHNVGLDIKRSLFTTNNANRGGAVYFSSKGRVENTTFHANQATDRGGALYLSENSALDGSSLSLAFTTITANTSPQGSAIWKHQRSPLELRANLIAENPGFALYTPFLSTTVEALSHGHNVIGRIDLRAIQEMPTDSLSTSEIPAGANPLADNGGFTHTQSLQSAVDALLRVPTALCLGADGNPLYQDQRRAPRPVGAFCSAGAWEDSAVPSANFEGFESTGLVGTGYTNGSFLGSSGTLFTYASARNQDQFPIDGPGLMLAAGGSLTFELNGGLDTLTIDYRKAFTSPAARTVEIRVNGQSRALSPTFGTISGTDDTVHTLTASNLGVSGPATIEIRVSGAQTVLDNLSWE